MYYFHLVAVCLLLTCLTSAYDVEKIIAPCKDSPVHQLSFSIDRTISSYKISLDDSNCNDKIFKLSLVISQQYASYCNENNSISITYTTSENVTKNETDWGCSGKPNHQKGNQYMYADHVVDDAKEFIIWRKSDLKDTLFIPLIAAAYFEPESENKCGKEYFDCTNNKGCESLNENNRRRCISNSLKCDFVPSCGMKCNVDEADEVCPDTSYKFDWEDFQYIVTTFLAALFFILSPTVIVFLLFYRKRMRLQEYQRRLQLEREVRAARERSMVITVSNRLNDHPPTYDDVHETKEPPPCFCAAVALSNAINQDKATEAESQGTPESLEIKFDCTCKV